MLLLQVLLDIKERLIVLLFQALLGLISIVELIGMLLSG